jgi:flavin reductase (DIM6/NTAB) family NADH-FMN oxidoreductase RutF
MAIAAQQFRDVLRLWASGVSVVTVKAPRGLASITVSSFASLSLDPPLVLVCIERRVRIHRLIGLRRAFAVNILAARQLGLSERAAGRMGRAAARLRGVGTRTAVTGAPILDGALAWLDCRLQARHAGGDHTIFVGRVEAAGAGRGRPLLWFDRGYHVPARAR